MVTHIGKPVQVEGESGAGPEQLRDRCKEGVEQLMTRHQRLPGSIWRGVVDRCCYRPRIHND